MVDDRIVPGDLMFVTPGDDALTKMISRYDASRFSHVGVALGDGEIASCRTPSDILEAGQIGGVRIDPLTLFQVQRHRNVYHAPLTPGVDVDRDAAVATARRLAEPDDETVHHDRTERSSFSFAKMFQCAVAVMASRRDSGLDADAADELVDLAIEAGRAWAPDPERPSFFCAEFVVSLYGWEFRREDLAPREETPTSPPTRGGEEVPAASTPSRTADLVALARNIWHYRSSPREVWTLYRLVDAVRHRAPQFWHEAATTLWQYLSEAHPQPVDVSATRGGDGLPGGLVTPRMLVDSGYVSAPRLLPGGPAG